MATQRESIELSSSPQEAIDACRRAVGGLDWNLSGEGERTLSA